jgi:hypothetical protein
MARRKPQSPDLFNCGLAKGLAAIGGFILVVIGSNRLLDLDPSDLWFFVVWAAYWAPVVWLMRNCIWGERTD